MRRLLVSLAVAAALGAGGGYAEGSYTVAGGYGLTYTLTSDSPITSFGFVYGDGKASDIQQPWNYQLSDGAPTLLADGLYQYNYTLIAGDNPSNSLTLGNVMYGPEGATASLSQMLGVLQNVQINEALATLKASGSYGISFAVPNDDKVLGAYYADWTIYGAHKYDIATLPLNYLNTVTYGFGKFVPSTGEAIMLDSWADYGAKTPSGVNAMPYLALERAANPNLNVIYSFGGWGTVYTMNPGVTVNHQYSSGDFSVLFQYYPQNIATLAQDMVSGIAKLGFNGVDIDYEWPAPSETQLKVLGVGNAPLCGPRVTGTSCNPNALTQLEADGYAELMYDLRQDLTTLSSQTGQKYYLSAALLSGPDKIAQLNGFTYKGTISALQGKTDFQNVMDSVNYVNLMSYDMHGAFDAPAPSTQAGPGNITDFQAPMAVDPVDTSLAPANQYSVEDAIAAITQYAPNDANKVLMGVPAYSRVVLTNGTNINPNGSVPANYLADGLYVGLASADKQSLDQFGYGEFVGDVWSQDFTGTSTDTAATNSLTPGIRGSGTFDYKCIVDAANCIMATSSDTPAQLFGAYSSTNPNYYQLAAFNATGPGSYAKTPWAFNKDNNAFMSFDNGYSAFYKGQYAMQHNMAGAFVWEVDGDVPAADSNYQTDSIIYNLWKAIAGGTTGQTITIDPKLTYLPGTTTGTDYVSVGWTTSQPAPVGSVFQLYVNDPSDGTWTFTQFPATGPYSAYWGQNGDSGNNEMTMKIGTSYIGYIRLVDSAGSVIASASAPLFDALSDYTINVTSVTYESHGSTYDAPVSWTVSPNPPVNSTLRLYVNTVGAGTWDFTKFPVTGPYAAYWGQNGDSGNNEMILNAGTQYVGHIDLLDSNGKVIGTATAPLFNPVAPSVTVDSINVGSNTPGAAALNITLSGNLPEGDSVKVTGADIGSVTATGSGTAYSADLTGLTAGTSYTVAAGVYDASGALVGSQVSQSFTDASNPPPPQTGGLLVGYMDSNGQTTMAESIAAGYNMIVVGWGSVNSDNSVTLSANADVTKAGIDAAHAAGAKVLVTFGGENNTFNPSANADPQTLANNIASLMQQYGFDGIDFDLESISYGANNTLTMVQDLKKLVPTAIITGAPQINAWINPKSGGGSIGFAPAFWNQLASSGLFTYIWVQDYNQSGGAMIYNDAGTLFEDTNPGFLALSYDKLLSLPYCGTDPSNPEGCTEINWSAGNTQLIIGEPSEAVAGTGLSDPAAIVADLSCLKNGTNCVAGVTPSKQYSNVAGLMTWSVGWDKVNNWTFANGVKECVVKGNC